MAFAWSTLVDALRTAVGAAWPDVLPPNGGGGIWEVDSIERIDFERQVLPYAVIEWAPISAADHAISNSAYDAPVMLHYVCQFKAAAGLTLLGDTGKGRGCFGVRLDTADRIARPCPKCYRP